MTHGIIRMDVGEPDCSKILISEYDWQNSVYGNVSEFIPIDTTKPYGKFVITNNYVDDNLVHCLLTSRSVTYILTLINKMHIDQFSKKKFTVEKATYRSEFVAA